MKTLMKARMKANQVKRRERPRYDAYSLYYITFLICHISADALLRDSSCCLYFPTQDSKDGAIEEEEKQAENGKKEEERGREPEAEREADKTESEMGAKVHVSQTQEILCSVKGEET